MKNKKGTSLEWILLPILFSSAAVMAGDQVSALTPEDPCAQCPTVVPDANYAEPPLSGDYVRRGGMNASEQAQALGQESDGFLNDAEEVSSGTMHYVGGNTRLGVGIDTEFKGRADLSHVFSETDSSVTSGQGWLGLNPMADKDKGEELITGAGVKLNHHWVESDEAGQPALVHKVFGAYDQNEAKDKKVTFGYGQEREDLFWSGHLSKGLSDKRASGTTSDGQTIYEKAYDYGVGGRVGTFMEDQLMRVQGGLDYEWGSEQAAGEKKPSQISISGGVEKFFPDSPHSIGANIEISKEQGGYVGDTHKADVSGSVNYRYDFGGEGLFAADQKYRRVRVEIPGKTIVTKKAPKVERKLVKHTMELESDTFFEVNKYNLTKEAQQRLLSVVARIRESGHEGNIRITGNTCDVGTTEHNQTLSEHRAASVRNFMIANGFNPGELMARGLGETHPKYPNTEATRHKNRRVDIEYVTYETKYKDEVIEKGGEVRTQSEPQITWRKELIPTPPSWVGQALRNNIQYKQTIDTYRTLGSGAAGGNGGDGNNPPVAGDYTVSTAIDEPVSFDVNSVISDPDGDQLTITITTQPAHGTVVLEDGLFTYTPNAGYSGPDSFTYTVDDGNGGTATATVNITVGSSTGGTGNAPQVGDDYESTTSGTPVQISALDNDSDPDGDTLTIIRFDETTGNGGTVTLTDGVFTYTPATDFVGTDTFTYTVSDGNGNEVTGTVTITVTADGANHAPNAEDDSKSTPVNTAVSINVLGNDYDLDGDALTITSIDETSANGGTVTEGEDGILIYTPATDFVGTDTFTYTVSDGNGGTATATVTVTVTGDGGGTDLMPDNDDYKIDAIDLDANGEIALNVLEGDVYSGSVTIRIITHPALGTIQNVDGSGNVSNDFVTYKPIDGETGMDSFVYVLVDADGNVSPQATVTIELSGSDSTGGEVDAVDDGADGKDSEYNFSYSDFSNPTSPRSLHVLGNDSGDGVTIVAITQPRFGSATISSDGTYIIYTPRDGYCEDHSFTYTVRDSKGNEDKATVYININ